MEREEREGDGMAHGGKVLRSHGSYNDGIGGTGRQEILRGYK